MATGCGWSWTSSPRPRKRRRGCGSRRWASSHPTRASFGTTVASCATSRIGASTTVSWPGRAWAWPGWERSPRSSSRGRRHRGGRGLHVLPQPRRGVRGVVGRPQPLLAPGTRPARPPGFRSGPGGSRGQPQLRDVPGVTPSSGRRPHVRAGLGALGAHARVRLLRRPGWIGGGVQDRHLQHRPHLDQAAPVASSPRRAPLSLRLRPG